MSILEAVISSLIFLFCELLGVKESHCLFQENTVLLVGLHIDWIYSSSLRYVSVYWMMGMIEEATMQKDSLTSHVSEQIWLHER